MNLRVLFGVAQSPPSPGPRYRVLQYLPFLESHGIRPTILPMQGRRSTDRSIRSRSLGAFARAIHYGRVWLESQVFLVRLVRMAGRFDRIFLYRIPVSWWARLLLARHRDRILVDFDDALDDAEGPDVAGIAQVRKAILRRGLINAIRLAKVTITSNRRNALAVAALGHRATVLPTSVDVARLPFRDRASPLTSRPVVGWIGTPSTAPYLQAIAGALRRVSETRPILIRFVGSGTNPCAGVDADVVEWTLEREPDELCRFDIGLMPMPDTPWTRGKAAAKALQYGASGAPTVATRTPTNEEILGDTEGTLFAQSEDEWVEALTRLLDDPALRGTMGRRGRRRVEQYFSVDVNAPRLVALIRNPAAAGLSEAP